MGQRSSRNIESSSKNYGQMLRIVNSVPEEVYVEILLFLDYKTILSFGKTCRDAYRISGLFYLWGKKIRKKYTEEIPNLNSMKREDFKKAYLRLETSLGGELTWDLSSCHHTLGIGIKNPNEVRNNIGVKSIHERDIWSGYYASVRTKQFLVSGYIYEWVVVWKKGVICNNIFGIGTKDFNFKRDGKARHTIGMLGGIGVIVGNIYDVFFDGKSQIERLTMEVNEGDEFWFKFDSRNSEKCQFFFAQNNDEYEKVGPDLDMINSYRRYYPHICIFSGQETQIVIEKKKRIRKIVESKEKVFQREIFSKKKERTT